LAVGPEALVSILVGSSIKEFTQWRDTNPSMDSFMVPELDPYRNIQATALLCLLVGIITFILGFFRLGFLDSVLSRALLRGFVLAVACVVMIDMSETLLGVNPPLGQCLYGPGGVFDGNTTLPVPDPRWSNVTYLESIPEPESPFQKLISILSRLGSSHFLTACISFVSISFLLSIRYLKRKYPTNKHFQIFPEILVLVVTSILLAMWFRWDCYGVAILNTVDSSLPSDVKRYPVPTLAKIKHLLLSAILISIIGFVESVVVAKTYASKHGYTVSPNRELVALGVGNVLSSFFGGFPAYGSLGRSAVNDAAGAKNQMAGLVTGLIVFLTAMWLLPLFQFLPKAVCSSIIVVAALRLIELEEVMFIVQLHAWKDLVLLLLTFLSTLFVSIETGTLISVAVSLLLVVKHTTTTRLVLLGTCTVVEKTGQRKLKFKNVKERGVDRVEDGLIIRFEEGLFFGNVGQLRERLKRIEVHGDLGIHPGEDPIPSTPQEEDWNHPRVQPRRIQYVILDMKGVSEIDARYFYG
jgi:MFS superfamily sulfate permease-like transporter